MILYPRYLWSSCKRIKWSLQFVGSRESSVLAQAVETSIHCGGEFCVLPVSIHYRLVSIFGYIDDIKYVLCYLTDIDHIVIIIRLFTIIYIVLLSIVIIDTVYWLWPILPTIVLLLRSLGIHHWQIKLRTPHQSCLFHNDNILIN